MLPYNILQCHGCGYILRDVGGDEVRLRPNIDIQAKCPYCKHEMVASTWSPEAEEK